MNGTPETVDPEGRLVENITHFTRALRQAGVGVGTSQNETAIRAVLRSGFTSRLDFRTTLRACLINRVEHLETFDRVFTLFWRDPEVLERMMRMMSPLLQTAKSEEKSKQAAERRAMDALTTGGPERENQPQRDVIEIDAEMSWSANEIFRNMDFEQMSAAELTAAKQAIRTLDLDLPLIRTRRFAYLAPTGRPDMRAIMRQSLRKGGEIDRILRKKPKTRAPDLVAICDISGSMSGYARMLMHFLHMLVWSNGQNIGRVHCFTFSTRLTNISRAIHLKDIDLAMDAVSNEAPDWKGGTRIAAALHQFNRDWSRRVLGQGATVLLITDGLERDDPVELERAASRLRRSCRHLLWLNPLLRWDDFQPLAHGIRTLLPHVDSFHACHSIASLAEIGQAIGGQDQKLRMMEMMNAQR